MASLPTKGTWAASPLQIQDQIQRFSSEVRLDKARAQRIIRARHYERWVVDPANGRVAPARYALWTGGSLKLLETAKKNDLDIPGWVESARLDVIKSGVLYDGSIARIGKLVPGYNTAPEAIRILPIRQRCLFSADPKLPEQLVKLKQKKRGSTKRLASLDVAIRLEEIERFRPAARSTVRVLVDQAKNARAPGSFMRNSHLHVVYRVNGLKAVFIPRRVTLTNLHHVVRDVLSEALEYRFRYSDVDEIPALAEVGKDLVFVVLFSQPVADDNEWVIRLLNHYGILVSSLDEGQITIQGRELKRLFSEALFWLR